MQKFVIDKSTTTEVLFQNYLLILLWINTGSFASKHYISIRRETTNNFQNSKRLKDLKLTGLISKLKHRSFLPYDRKFHTLI